MQITVTDHNDWEGEDFSFILEVDEPLAQQIKQQEDNRLTVELDTEYTWEQVRALNKNSTNGYMDRFGFYQFKTTPVDFKEIYEDIFYKARGLQEIKA